MAAPATTTAARRPIALAAAVPALCCRPTANSLSFSSARHYARAIIAGTAGGTTTKTRRSNASGGLGLTVVGMSMEAGIGVMGTKLGMMTYFEPGGAVVPVTVVGFREGNIVTQLKTAATDGYDAVQVGYRRVRDRKLTKPELGHLAKAGAVPLRHLQEFRLQSLDGFEPGQRLAVEEIFKEGDLVDVSGDTIGKGFQEHLLTV